MTDKTREDFEVWLVQRKGPTGDTPGYPGSPPFYHDQEDAAWEGYQAATQQSAARIASLEAEVLALRKDAERYKWLRSVPNGFKAQRIVNDTPHGMDAAIDAAIEAERGEG